VSTQSSCRRRWSSTLQGMHRRSLLRHWRRRLALYHGHLVIGWWVGQFL
jgi:hypothetical protein